MALRTVLSVILLLLIPAFVYCASVYRHDDLTIEYLSKWFVGNYAFMATPHFLMLWASIFGPMPRSVLQVTLIVLNAILVLFQCWIWFVVPGRESGLAWVFYIPVWILGLCAVYAFYYFTGKQRGCS
jgi:hypothetical protein